MENRSNPYLPPNAPVSDIETSPSAAQRAPSPHVERACGLLWIGWSLSVAIGLFDSFSSSSTAIGVGVFIGVLVGDGISFVILFWMTGKLRAGKNWMRWLLTALYVAGWMSVPIFWDFYRMHVVPVVTSDTLANVNAIVQMGTGIVALAYLHTRSARQWFRMHKRENLVTG